MTKSLLIIGILLFSFCGTARSQVCPEPLLTPAAQAKGKHILAGLTEQAQEDQGHVYSLREFTNAFLNAYFNSSSPPPGLPMFSVIAKDNLAYQHGSQQSLLQACFPGIKSFYDSVLAKREEQQVAANQAAELERNKPENKLRSLYEDYLSVKACYEARNGYLIVLINEAQMEQARRSIKESEDGFLKSNPGLDTAAIWKSANDGFGGSVIDSSVKIIRLGGNGNFDFVKTMCTTAYEELVSQQDQSRPVKKDF